MNLCNLNQREVESLGTREVRVPDASLVALKRNCTENEPDSQNFWSNIWLLIEIDVLSNGQILPIIFPANSFLSFAKMYFMLF